MDWVGPVPSAAQSACSQLDYNNTVAGAAATTPSAFRHHRRRRRRASGDSGDCGIPTPMQSLRRSGSGCGSSGSTPTPQADSAGLSSWVWARWGPIRIGWGPIRIGWDPFRIGWVPIWIGWAPIRMGWGSHQLQPSLPSHSSIYIHCFTPSSFDNSGQLFCPANSDSLLSL